MPEPVIFWDIDGTLVQPSMERLFLRYLRHNKLLRFWELPLNALRLLPTSRGQFHRLKLAYLRNLPEEQVNEWMDDCFSSVISKRLISPCIDAIRTLNETGMTNILLSGTLDGLAKRLAGQLDISDTITATPEIVDGRYTGRLTDPHPYARHKVVFADRWLTQHNRNWSEVIAIADHWQDRGLLQKAALPIVINPADSMRKFAHSEGWLVLSRQNGSLSAENIIEPILTFKNSLQ